MTTPMMYRPHVMYVLKAADDWVLYVGATWNLEKRMGEHSRLKAWWPNVAKVQVTMYPDRHHALKAERVAIESLFPEHNIAPGYWSLPSASRGHVAGACGFCLAIADAERKHRELLAEWAAEDAAEATRALARSGAR